MFTSVLFLSSLSVALGMARQTVYAVRDWCAVYSLLHSTSLYFIAGCSHFGKHRHETVWWINYHLIRASEKLGSQAVLMG